jgi:enamine deaminase RidA (YjgF/YER057c/UK114 family)
VCSVSGRGTEARLLELGLQLPACPTPVGSYTPTQLVGNLLYTSGALPVRDGELAYPGVVGAGLSVAEATEAARLCALNILAMVRAAAGSLDAVEQVVQVIGFVRSAPGFAQQPKVLNGASDLLFSVFGERGRHARMALGTAELPLGAAVELSAIIRVTGRAEGQRPHAA